MTNTRTFYHFGALGVIKPSAFKDDQEAINWAKYHETWLDKVRVIDYGGNGERITVDMIYDPITKRQYTTKL